MNKVEFIVFVDTVLNLCGYIAQKDPEIVMTACLAKLRILNCCAKLFFSVT